MQHYALERALLKKINVQTRWPVLVFAMLANKNIYGARVELPKISLMGIPPNTRDLVAALRAAGLFVCGNENTRSTPQEFGTTWVVDAQFPCVFIGCPLGTEDQVVEIVQCLLDERPELVSWPVSIDVLDLPPVDDGLPDVGAVAVWHTHWASRRTSFLS